MRIVISVLAILFGLLHIIAAVTQFKSKDPAARGSAVIMVCGGIGTAAAAIGHLTQPSGGDFTGVAVALEMCAALLLVNCAAWLNGKRSGKLHLSHHIVRGVIAALLVVGFVVW